MSIDQPDLDDLRQELDASFGDGPDLLLPGHHLAAGRRALRRRRFAVTGSGAAVALVVVAGSFAVLGGNGTGERGGDPLAPAPSVITPTTGDVDEAQLKASLDQLALEAQQHAEEMSKARLVSNQFPAALDEDGSLVVKDGWEVTRRVPEPVGLEAPEASLGVVVTDGQRTRWMLLTLERVRGRMSPGASADDPGTGYSRFEDWLASMVAISGGAQSGAQSDAQPDALVTVGVDDQVAAGPGSTLVDVQEIDVIEGYTSPGDRIAEVRRDGRTWFVVIRGHGSDAELVPVDAAVLPESTLAALLTYVSQQIESGAGAR